MVQMAKEWSPYLLWLTCAVGEFSLYMWIDNTVTQYKNIRYLECRLRPLICRLVGNAEFWAYEQFLAEGRKKHVLWWEMYPLLVAPVFLAGIATIRVYGIIATKEFSKSNWIEIVAFALCALIAVGVFLSGRRALSLRRHFFVTPQPAPGEEAAATPPPADQ
jgi:hypothetical protein